MLKFIHAADFHLDSPFAGLAPYQAAERRRESRAMVDRMAEYADREGVGLVLLAGDLFDSDSVYRETYETLAQALGKMKCPVCIAPGNHDCCTPQSPYAAGSWPDNVHIFLSRQVEKMSFPEIGVSVYGAAFTAPEQTESLMEGFRAEADGLTPLMVLHGDLGVSGSPYNPIREEQVADSGLAYLALGHIHRRSAPARAGRTLWAYAGCPEGRGFDETGEKGFYLCTVDGETVSAEFVPFAHRRYERIEVDVTGQDAADAVKAAVPPDTQRDLYRILLTGETGEAGVDLTALQKMLQDRFYQIELRDGTRVQEDVWARAGEDSLRGLFLKELRQKWDSAEDEAAREILTQAVRFGLAAIDNRDLV